jgi:muramidase (phage lysozyme)
MIPLERIRAALNTQNGQAWLRVIREGESTQRPIAYRVLYGWHPQSAPNRIFSGWNGHPRFFTRLANGRRTSAAGAYQITATSWDDMRRRRPGVYTDFGPGMQDLWAMDRTAWRGALDDVLLGRLDIACTKCAKEWTSLPGGPEQGQDLVRAQRVFQQWGGRLAA